MSTAEIGVDLGRYKLGWSDEEDYVFKPKKGLNTDIITEMSRVKGEPEWMFDFRLKSYQRFQRRPGRPGRRHQRASTSTTSTTTSSPPRGWPTSGTPSPSRSRTPTSAWASPRPERKYLAGVTAQYESEVVYHRNRADLEELGVLFCDMDTALRGIPRDRQGLLRQDHPAQRQQVRRAQLVGVVGGLVHLRPARRRSGHAAAGLLPHQRREHGPVRADLDHRRRGLQGALHRGLLGPHLLHRLAALGRGGDRGGAVGSGHLHHHPELVRQRLQPGHQAGPGGDRGPHGMDRRQHRLPGRGFEGDHAGRDQADRAGGARRRGSVLRRVGRVAVLAAGHGQALLGRPAGAGGAGGVEAAAGHRQPPVLLLCLRPVPPQEAGPLRPRLCAGRPARAGHRAGLEPRLRRAPQADPARLRHGVSQPQPVLRGLCC